MTQKRLMFNRPQGNGAKDPLLAAITDYRTGLADFNLNAPRDNDGANSYADVSYGPHLDRLTAWVHPAGSREGAIEALRIALTEEGGVYGSLAADQMVRAALGYLESAWR